MEKKLYFGHNLLYTGFIERSNMQRGLHDKVVELNLKDFDQTGRFSFVAM
jgi:hypothetical protein